MRTKSAIVITSVLCFILLGMTAPVGGEAVAPSRVLPDDAFTALVQEANRYIHDALKKSDPRFTYLTLRASALVIALAADNRILNKDAARSAAALRDAALNLVEGLELHYDSSWVLSHPSLKLFDNRAIHAELAKRFAPLERFAELKPDTQSRPVRYRLSSRFTHDDVTIFFGGCGGRHGHKIDSELARLTRAGMVLAPAELPPLELMGNKLALVGELLRDYEEHSQFFTPQLSTLKSAERRKEWVDKAMDLEQGAWELAKVAREKNLKSTSDAVHKVKNTCTACHRRTGF